MNKYFTNFSQWTKRNSPQILMWCGITSGLTSLYFGITGTKKFINEVNRRKAELETEKLPGKEVAKIALKSYWPAALTEMASVGCIVGSNHISNRRTAALAVAYKASETALLELNEKTLKTIGEKKMNDIRSAIAEDKLEKNPPSKENGGASVVLVGDGDILCYDEISGRYFKSNAEKIRRAQNLLNEQLNRDMYMSLNEFYDLVGLDTIKLGDEVGWNVSKEGLLEIHFSTHLTKDDQPCLSIGYSVAPRYDYSKLY